MSERMRNAVQSISFLFIILSIAIITYSYKMDEKIRFDNQIMDKYNFEGDVPYYILDENWGVVQEEFGNPEGVVFKGILPGKYNISRSDNKDGFSRNITLKHKLNNIYLEHNPVDNSLMIRGLGDVHSYNNFIENNIIIKLSKNTIAVYLFLFISFLSLITFLLITIYKLLYKYL